MNPDKPNFLDRGTIIALVLVMLVWFGWSRFMDATYPKPPPTAAAANAPANAPTNALANSQAPLGPVAADSKNGATSTGPSPQASTQPTGQAAESAAETALDFSDSHWSFQVSSRGMGLKNINLKEYKTRSGDPIILGDVKGPYSFATGFAQSANPIDFRVEKAGDDTFVGHADVNGLQVEKTLKINSDNYTIDSQVKISGPNATSVGLSTYLSDALPDRPKGGFLSSSSSYDNETWFIRHDNTKTRNVINKEKGGETQASNVAVAALSSHYFALAVVDQSDLFPRFASQTAPGSPEAVGRLIYQPVNPATEFTAKFKIFAGPKSFHLLSSIDEGLSKVVDYGMFAIIAKPILWLLKFLQSIIGNWGFAIIVLTILVRLIVLPFNVFSYKSMKAMQKIQPEMNRIREKYKDKPVDQRVQMNQEIMELMKRSKANPLGGCLPMLLQLPVFFALYQVLGQSIELYRAPFIFWIQDLSAMDHFYVLPVLMGITMFLQQRLTPTTMDPQQAKILMWMPVIFSFFMLSLPSGLTLYIFVSTLFGICQQMVFMRDRSQVQSVKEAKA